MHVFHAAIGVTPWSATVNLFEMVDPNYVVIAGIDKRYLPVKR